MNVVAQVLAVLQGVLLITVGALEAFQYRNPRWYSIFLIEPQDRTAVRLWTVNVGFYNMIMGLATIIGVVLLWAGDPVVGRTLVLYNCVAHIILGIVLTVVEPRLRRNSFAEAALPLLIVVLWLTLG